MVRRIQHAMAGLLIGVTMGRPVGAQRPVIDVGLALVNFLDDHSTVFGPSVRLSASGSQGNVFGSASGGGVATLGAASGFATLEGGVRS